MLAFRIGDLAWLGFSGFRCGRRLATKAQMTIFVYSTCLSSEMGERDEMLRKLELEVEARRFGGERLIFLNKSLAASERR